MSTIGNAVFSVSDDEKAAIYKVDSNQLQKPGTHIAQGLLNDECYSTSWYVFPSFMIYMLNPQVQKVSR